MAAPVISVSNQEPAITISGNNCSPGSLISTPMAIPRSSTSSGTAARPRPAVISGPPPMPIGLPTPPSMLPRRQLSNVWLRAGSVGGSETLWVRAFDGTDWGNWATFTFTTIPNTTPVATINDQALHVNHMGTGQDFAELLRRQRRRCHQIPVLGQRCDRDQRLFLDADQLTLGCQHHHRSFGRRPCQCLGPGRLERPAPRRCGYARSTAPTGAPGTPSP